MANLEVNQNIFRYKETRYQIRLMQSIRIIEREIKNKRFGQVYSPVLFLKLFGLGIIPLLALLIFENGFVKLILLAITGLLWFKGNEEFENYSKNKEESKRQFYTRYELSIRFSHGGREVFGSYNKNTISIIHDALHKAMRKEDVSINLDNVDITIIDSKNVNIANSER